MECDTEDAQDSSLTITELEAIALGQMDMTPGEFAATRLRTFFLKLLGLNRIEEQRFRATANLVRLQTLTLVNVQIAQKHRLTDPRQLWSYPWEEKIHKKRPSITPEQMRERTRRMIEVLKGLS